MNTETPLALPERAVSAAEVQALADGSDTALEELRAAMVAQFSQGARAIRLRGLDPVRLGEDGMAAALLRIGRWLGEPSLQSPAGELVARVEQRADDPQARGTSSALELRAHTDLHDILALACVRPAAAGGESFLVSAADLHRRLLASAPQHLPALYAGWYFGTNPVLQSVHRVSPAKVPVFLRQAGTVQACCNPYFLRAAAAARGEPLPAELAEALDALQAAAEGVAADTQFLLDAGDALVWHNWSWLHGRRAFTGDRPRLLLRLWLRSGLCGPTDARLTERGAWIDEDHRLTAERGMRAA